MKARDYKDAQAVCYRKGAHPQTAEEPQTWEQTDTNDTLNAFDSSESRTPTLVYESHGQDSRYRQFNDVSETVSAKYGMGGGNVPMALEENTVVRRLTPLECERLQGYPDHWTDIGEWIDTKGKKHKDADSPRYKALGNSIALPFWEWMAKRMVQYIDHKPTMASLFDGISGFCLVYARAGVKPVFSSEIEEFPIAVAKKHFGDDDLGLEGDYERYL